MRELSLFTGAGGGILGSKLLGWTTVGYVEFNDYCQRVIKQRIADGILDNAPIFGDIRAFNSEGYAESYKGMVDIVTGGFPCQPFSVAGKQLGSDDPRNMWPETIRTIRTVRPRFALLENVAGILSTGYFERICGDLVEIGYDCRWRVLSAAEVGAPHKRDRLWILATDSTKIRWVRTANKMQSKAFKGFEVWGTHIFASVLDVEKSQYQVKSEDERMGDGMAYGMDRFRAIGNGQVPAVVRAAWEILSEGLVV